MPIGKKPTYTVTLDINGGSNGGTTTSVVATLGEKLPLHGDIRSPAISDNAKEFQGYTDDLRLSSVGRLYSGHRYYDTGGAGNKVKEGERVWDYPEDKTIYAYYGIINYGHEIIIKDPNDANYSGLTTIQSDGYFSYPSLPTRTGFSIAGYTEIKMDWEQYGLILLRAMGWVIGIGVNHQELFMSSGYRISS